MEEVTIPLTWYLGSVGGIIAVLGIILGILRKSDMKILCQKSESAQSKAEDVGQSLRLHKQDNKEDFEKVEKKVNRIDKNVIMIATSLKLKPINGDE